MTAQAAVVGGPTGPAAEVAAGLSALGCTVALLAAGTRADLAAQLRAAGSVQLVVWAPDPGAAATPSSLLEHGEAQWDAEAAEPLRQAIACFQAAGESLEPGAAIVALIPTLAMSGSPGFTAWTTASEGLRSLVKVAAREFGRKGISVNAVALPAQTLATSTRSLDRAGLPAAVFTPPSGAGEAASILAALAAPPWTSVTGATIALDGGVWMPA